MEIEKVKVILLLKALRLWLGKPTPNSSGLLCMSRGTLISSRTFRKIIINEVVGLHHNTKHNKNKQNLCSSTISFVLLTSFWMHSNNSLLTSSLVMFSTWLYLDYACVVFAIISSMFTFLSVSGSSLRLSSGSACPPGLSTLEKVSPFFCLEYPQLKTH